jgi:hypothetical protein
MKIIKLECLNVVVHPCSLYLGGPKFEFQPHDALLNTIILVEMCHTYR